VLPAGLGGRDNLAAQTIALAARLVTFAASFRQEPGRQRPQHGDKPGGARQWRDVVGTSMPNRGQSGVVSMVSSSPHIRAGGIANIGNRAASRHLRY